MKEHKKAIGKRVIALCLAALLLFVPFSSNWEKMSSVKAEDSDQKMECFPRRDIGEEPKLLEDIVIGEAPADSYFAIEAASDDPYIIHSLDGSVEVSVKPNITWKNNNIAECEIKKDGGSFKGVVKGWSIWENRGNVDVDVTITPVYTVKYSFSIGYLPYTDTPATYLDEAAFENTFSMDGTDNKYALYVKSTVVSAELTEVKCEPDDPWSYRTTDANSNFEQTKDLIEANTDIIKYDSAWKEESNQKAVYSLQKRFEYTVDDLEAKWIGQGEGYDSDKDGVADVYKSAKLGVEKYEKYTNSEDFASAYLGEVKYSILRSDVKLVDPEFVDWGKDDTHIMTDESGYYYGAISYYIGDKLLVTTLSKEILIDKTAPTIEVLGLYQSEGVAPSEGGEAGAGEGGEAGAGEGGEAGAGEGGEAGVGEGGEAGVGEGGEAGAGEGGEAGATTPTEKWKHLDVANGYKITADQAESGMYRYVIRVTDATEVKSVTYKSSRNINGDFACDSENKMGLGDNVYYYIIDKNDVPSNKHYEFMLDAYAKDALDNQTEGVRISPSIKKFDGSLTVSAKFYINGENVDTFPTRSKESVKVVVSAISANPICKVEVVDKHNYLPDEILDTATTPENFKNEKNSISDGNGTVYNASYSFDLPVETANKKMDDISVYVYEGELNEDGSIKATNINAVEKSLGQLLFDNTKPTLKVTDEPVNGKWYQSFTLKGTINTGTDENFEDEFEYAKYYMKADGIVDKTSDTAFNIVSEYTSLKSKEFEIPVDQSTSDGGTKVVFVAKDKAGNELEEVEYNIRVDGEAPVIDTTRMYVVSKDDAIGKRVTPDGAVEGGGQVAGNPIVRMYASDNLTLDYAKYTIECDGKILKTDTIACAMDKPIDIPVLEFAGSAKDGIYKVSVQVYDKAGNFSKAARAIFTIDNTIPVFSAEITGAIRGGKDTQAFGTYEFYSSESVGITFTAEDNNIDTDSIVITDGANVVPDADYSWSKVEGRYVAQVDIAGEGYHRVTISGRDKAGNSGITKSVEFLIDSVHPTVSAKLNGSEYRGSVKLQSDVTLEFDVSDAHVDENDNYCTVTREVPGRNDSTETYPSTSRKVYSFSEDGHYIVKFYAKDFANNQSGTQTVEFWIDKNAPQIQILGASGVLTSDTTVTFVINETMYSDATCEAKIYRKAGDSKEEYLYKPVTIPLTGAETRYSVTISETGIYRIEVVAKDAIGHSVPLEQQFTLDKNPPVVSMTGVKNYDKTENAVDFYLEVNEDFFVNKTVSVKGTKTDINGKVENLDYASEIVQGANPTIFKKVFDQDGIYDLQILAKDPAGNEHTDNVHFIIDTQAPVIGDLSKYEDQTLREFDWDVDLDELVSDLTVCDVHMYLNGSEYDGSPNIEDGVYTLLIVAEDELGHKTEKSINFTLDTKAPVFIVTGVEDGEIKNEAYKITVSLQLDEDILDSVMLNGSSITISENNTVTIDVTSEGKYELTLHARDIAGNEAEQTISFAYGKETKTNSLWLIAAIAGGIVVVGGIIFIILAKRRKDNDRY